MQIHAEGSYGWPILYWSLHPCQKRPEASELTGGAPHLLHLMLSHDQVYGRQVIYLPVFFGFP